MFIVIFMAMKILGPDDFAYWTLLSPFLIYSPLLTLGLTNSLNRLAPIHLAQKNTELLQSLYSTTLFIILFVSLLLGIFLFTIFSLNFVQFNSLISLFFILIVIHLLHQFYLIILRVNQEFRLYSIMMVLLSFLMLFICSYAMLSFGLYGFIFGQLISMFITLIFIISSYKESSITLKFSLNSYFLLLKDGFPVASQALILGFALIADRYIIGIFYGVEVTGNYALSIYSHSIMVAIPVFLSQYFYPVLNFHLGKKDGNNLLKKFKEYKIYSYAVNILISLLLFILSFYLDLILPEYKDGINAMRINIFTAIILGIGGPWNSLLLSLGKHQIRLFIALVFSVINIMLCLIFASLNLGIEGVAFATLLASLIMSIMNYYFCIQNMKPLMSW